MMLRLIRSSALGIRNHRGKTDRAVTRAIQHRPPHQTCSHRSVLGTAIRTPTIEVKTEVEKTTLKALRRLLPQEHRSPLPKTIRPTPKIRAIAQKKVRPT